MSDATPPGAAPGAGAAAGPDAAAGAGSGTDRLRRRISRLLLGGRGSVLVPLLAAAVLLIWPIATGDAYWIRELTMVAIFALVVGGVNLSFGYAGEVQFGQVFMFGLGAYLTMVLAIHGLNEIVLLMLIGGLAAAATGVALAFPAVRVGGWALAIGSFFLVVCVPDLISILRRWTGGLDGLVGIPAPNLLGSPLSMTGLYAVAFCAALLWFVWYRNVVTSRYGVIFRILRESTVLLGSLGFSTLRLKTAAFALGAFPAGVAGCLYGYVSLVLAPSDFGLTLSIGIVAASVLGGVESVYGAIIGAAILRLLPQVSVSFSEYAAIAYGAFIIVAAIAFGPGIGGVSKQLARRAALAIAPAADAARLVHVPPDWGGAGVGARAPGAAPVEGDLAADGQELTIDGIDKSFGGVKALQGVSLTARPGEITALLGSNGSGKTTLLNAVSGYQRVDAGSVRLGASTLSGMAPHRIARIGVSRTFQTPLIPRGVSVLDVVASGRYQADGVGFMSSALRLPRYRRAGKADRAAALALLRRVGLAELAGEEAGALSLGNRRLLEVARALCARPGLLLLDEPASGLSETELERLAAILTAAAEGGAAVVLIEHNFEFVARLAKVAHVLDRGQLIASGTPEQVRTDPEVVRSYLGQRPGDLEVARRPARVAQDGERPLIEVDLVDTGYGDLQVLRGMSLAARRGEIAVVLGRNGAGKTTLLGAISGQRKVWRGEVRFGGEDISSVAAHRRAARGIALVQEGKRIFHHRTVLENIKLGTYGQRLGRTARHELCLEILAQFPMLEERAIRRADGLSGGQQQMLAIAQALASRPQLLLLDEPSAGLAPAIVSDVFDTVRRLGDEGMTIVLVEQRADEALRIADHVSVLDDGHVVASGAPGEFAGDSTLKAAYFGGATPAENGVGA